MVLIYPLFNISKNISTSIANEEINYRTTKEILENHDFNLKIYDNFENLNNKKDKTVFSDLIIENINNAKKEIYIAMYSFDIPAIRDVLYEAHKRGVEITLIYNGRNKDTIEEFLKDNLDYLNIFYVKNSEGNNYLMHHKFLLVDPGTKNEKLITGPWNWSKYQETLDPNILFEIIDKEIIASYYAETKRILNGNYGPYKFRDWSFMPWDKIIKYPSGEIVELWFSPGRDENSLSTRIVDLINAAENSIDIAITVFDSKAIADALINKAQEGVSVNMIIDVNTKDPDETIIFWLKNEIEKLKLNNFKIYYGAERKQKDKIYTIFHYHNMVIDDKITLTSTANWTYGGFWLNDENTLIIHSERLSKEFNEIFNRYLYLIN